MREARIPKATRIIPGSNGQMRQALREHQKRQAQAEFYKETPTVALESRQVQRQRLRQEVKAKRRSGRRY